MSSLTNLTDDEIRAYLVKLNLPIVPLTDSTRHILLKKIQGALDGTADKKSARKASPARSNASPARSNASPARRSANVSVSNDHHKDEMLPPSLPIRRNSRGRSGVDSPHPYSSRKSNTSIADASMDEVNSSITSPTKRRGRTVKATPSYLNGFETGSDSDVPEKPSSPKRASPITRSFKSPIFPSVFSNLPTSFRKSDLTPPNSRPATPAVNNGHDTFDFSRQPISNYSPRFSSSNTYANSTPSYIKESDEEISPRLPRGYFAGAIQSNNLSTTKKPTFSTSKILIGCFALFFICIAFIYFNIRANSSAHFSNSDTKYPTCGSGRTEPGVTCIMDDDIPVAIEFLPSIYDELYQRSVFKHCGYPNTEDRLTDQDIKDLISEKKPTTTDWELQTHVPNIKLLISSNPRWTLKVLDGAIVLSRVELPVTCSINSFLAKLIFYSVQCIILLVGTGIAYKAIQFYLERKEKSKREVLKMVDDILHTIRNQAEKCPEQPYLPIRHVKDSLIPLYDRERLNKVWQGVMKMLDNEARIRQEIQLVQGEDQDVWRWLPPQTIPASSTSSEVVPKKHKTWQGAAFETDEGSVNALPTSPTACLKIRNMFDPREEDDQDLSWVRGVEDALLEKCVGISILHIGVDRTSAEGIVFVKCASCAEAGRAFKALHGAWFNRRLVTVKYLRFERYHERFPQAKSLVVPLQPSNDAKYSIQQ